MKTETKVLKKNSTLTVTDSTFNPPTSDVYVTSVTSRTDSVIAGALVRGDKVRPNPWNYSIVIDDLGSETYTRRVGKAVYSYSGPCNTAGAAVASENLAKEIDNCYNDALNSFNEKVRGTLDLSVDLAQGAQTAGMINKAKAVVELTRKFRRRLASPWKWRETVTTTGSLWLEWQYGWMPLVSSIHGLLEQMGGDGQGWVKPIRTGSARQVALPATALKYISGLGHYCKVNGQSSVRVSIQGKVQLAGISPATVSSLNPASIAWELLPYSFVVDWFYSVGDYLRAVETATLYNPNWMYGHYTTSVVTEATLESSDKQGVFETFSANMGYRHVDVRRRVLSEYPSPRLPSLNVDLGSGQLLNAAALLSQLLR